MVTAIVLLGVSGFGLRAVIHQLNIFLRKEAVPLRAPFAGIPSRLGEWQQIGSDVIMDEAMVEELGTRQYLDRRYALDGDPSKGVINLHLAYYTGMIDAVPHVPERCWVAGGLTQVDEAKFLPIEVNRSTWRPSDVPPNRASGLPYHETDVRDLLRGVVPVHMPVDDLELRTVEFQSTNDPDTRVIGGYLFLANGRATSSAIGVRKLAFDRTDKYAYYCKLQLTMVTSARHEDRLESYQAQCADFLSHLLPHLMLRLPDWPEIEATAADVASSGRAQSTGS